MLKASLSALHQSYNAAANCSVDLSVLDEVPSQATRSWVLFSLLEMQKALKACSNVSAPGPDHITWRYITDAIHTARQIFDSFFHPYQLHSIAISQDLRAFFNKRPSSSIAFWDCPSSAKWHSHLAVDKETKQFKH